MSAAGATESVSIGLKIPPPKPGIYRWWPEFMYKRWKNGTGRYKVLMQVQNDGPWELIGWVVGSGRGGWEVAGELTGIEGTFKTRGKAAQAISDQIFKAKAASSLGRLQPLWRALPQRSDRALSREVADKVWDLLIQYGASDHRDYDRDSFAHHHSHDSYSVCGEYRFQGVFGFSGKFRNSGNSFYVDYDSNKEGTPYRDWLEAKLNWKLHELYMQEYPL